MARTILKPGTANLRPIPSPIPNREESKRLGVLANGLFNLSKNLNGRIDDQVARAAQLAGIEAGADPNLKLQSGTTIADQEYNRAAINSFGAKLELQTRKHLNELFLENPDDPVALESEINDYREGILRGLSVDQVELRDIANNLFDRETLPFVDKALTNRQQLIKDQALTDINGLLEFRFNNASTLASEGLLTPERAADLALERESYRDLLAQLGPKGQFTVGGTTYAQELGRPGALSISDIDAKLKEFDKMIITQVVSGGLDRAISVNQGAKYVLGVREQLKTTILSADEQNSVVAGLTTQLNRIHSLQNDGLERSNKLRTDRHRRGAQSLTIEFLEGNLDPDKVTQMLRDDQITESFARTMFSEASQGAPAFDDPTALVEYKMDLLDFPEEAIVHDNRLTVDSRLNLIEERRALEKGEQAWRNSQNGSEGARRIRGEFGILGGDSIFTKPEDALQATRALTEYFDRVNALPLEEREANAVRISNEVITEINARRNQDEIARLQKRVEERDFQTLEEIEAADLSGYEKRVQTQRLQMLLNKIEQLRREQ